MNFCVVHVSCACAIVVRRVESVRMKKMEAIDEVKVWFLIHTLLDEKN